MKANAGAKPILCERTGVYMEPSTPAPNGSFTLSCTTAILTGTLVANAMYRVFTRVADAYMKCATGAAEISGVTITGMASANFLLAQGIPERFYAGPYTKVGVLCSASSGDCVFFSRMYGDELIHG